MHSESLGSDSAAEGRGLGLSDCGRAGKHQAGNGRNETRNCPGKNVTERGECGNWLWVVFVVVFFWYFRMLNRRILLHAVFFSPGLTLRGHSALIVVWSGNYIYDDFSWKYSSRVCRVESHYQFPNIDLLTGTSSKFAEVLVWGFKWLKEILTVAICSEITLSDLPRGADSGNWYQMRWTCVHKLDHVFTRLPWNTSVSSFSNRRKI